MGDVKRPGANQPTSVNSFKMASSCMSVGVLGRGRERKRESERKRDRGRESNGHREKREREGEGNGGGGSKRGRERERGALLLINGCRRREGEAVGQTESADRAWRERDCTPTAGLHTINRTEGGRE